MARMTDEYGISRSEDIPSYLIPALLALICCWPLAIVAIIFAAQVNSRIDRGDIAGAKVASGRAKTWSYTSIGIGLVLYLLSALLGLFFFAGAMNYGFR